MLQALVRAMCLDEEKIHQNEIEEARFQLMFRYEHFKELLNDYYINNKNVVNSNDNIILNKHSELTEKEFLNFMQIDFDFVLFSNYKHIHIKFLNQMIIIMLYLLLKK